MATLAALLTRRGHDVQGSDQHVYPPMSDFLVAEGIRTFSGYAADHLGEGLDLVVVGNAISRGNPELEAVLERKIRYCSMPAAVRDHFLWGQRSTVIAGTHGKTTTTALTGWLLANGGLDPTVLVGGIARNFGHGGSSYRVGEGRDFVIEGDEYDSAYFDKTAKFLKYLPEIAVVNNVEFDHADIYASLDEIRLAFRRLVGLVPRNGLLLLGADSDDALRLREVAVSPVQTFGLAADADWHARELEHVDGVTEFSVRHDGRMVGRFVSPLLGAHNVRNALAAIAVGAHVGLGIGELKEGLRSFAGIKRRLETVGVRGGVTVIDDFAHHPTAVGASLAALRQGFPARRIWAVFEPRSATSCRRVFQDDFARALGAADEVIVARVFRTSLPPDERLSADGLVEALGSAGRRARHIPGVDEIVSTIVGERRQGDVVAVMSNGAFGGIHTKLLEALAR